MFILKHVVKAISEIHFTNITQIPVKLNLFLVLCR